MADLIECEIVPRWRVPRYPQSEYLRRLLDQFDIECVFDVGANTGQYHDYLRQEVGFRGLIVSFEPHPDCVASLREKQVDDPNWRILDFALGDKEGSLQFNLMSESQFSSFLTPDNARRPDFSPGNQVVRSVEARVRTLDAVLPELQAQLQLGRPFLKLDTQGFDLAVMRGAQQVAHTFAFVQTEISNIPIYRDIPAMAETVEYFRANGWDLGSLFPTNPEQFPVRVDFDGYFVSQRHQRDGRKSEGS